MARLVTMKPDTKNVGNLLSSASEAGLLLYLFGAYCSRQALIEYKSLT